MSISIPQFHSLRPRSNDQIRAPISKNYKLLTHLTMPAPSHRHECHWRLIGPNNPTFNARRPATILLILAGLLRYNGLHPRMSSQMLRQRAG